jgi:arylsulfatase A-like enzyme
MVRFSPLIKNDRIERALKESNIKITNNMKTMIRILVSFCVPILLLLTNAGCTEKKDPPNFILILTDDQSWVGTSYLADPEDPRSRSDYYQTPNMERLAEMGMRFSNGYSPAPFCCPTRKSITIGQTPAKHEYQRDRENWTINFRKQLSIPQMLKKANPRYQTAHFGKWDARYDEVTPEEMGYDFSDGLTGNSTGGGKSNIEWPVALQDPKLIFSLTRRAGEFMENQVAEGNPFYLQVSHYAVHLGITYTQGSFDKYTVTKPGEKHFIPEFAAMTEDMDVGIGILLDKVEELGIMDNTYIIFMSDNGGRRSQPIGADQLVPRNFPLRDGKGSMYEGGIRVPFVVAGPNVVQNSYSDVPVVGTDILPTLADLAGYRENLPAALDGGSFKNVIHNQGKGEISRKHPYLIFHHAVNRRPQSAIREGNFKLVKTWEQDRLELFDLSKDVSEANNLADEMPEKARELEEKLVSFLNEVGAEIKRTRD